MVEVIPEENQELRLTNMLQGHKTS